MTLDGHTDTVTGVSLSPDGTHLLSYDRARIGLCTCRMARELRCAFAVLCVT